MARRGGLGRGLDSLIPNKNAVKKESKEPEKPAKKKKTVRRKERQEGTEEVIEKETSEKELSEFAEEKTEKESDAPEYAEESDEEIEGESEEEYEESSDEDAEDESNGEEYPEEDIEESDEETEEETEEEYEESSDEDAEEESDEDEYAEEDIEESDEEIEGESEEYDESSDEDAEEESDEDEEEFPEGDIEESDEETEEESEEEYDESADEDAEEKSDEVEEEFPEGDTEESENDSEKGNSHDFVINMKISQVEPNREQPRKYFDDDAISELADSIRQFGVIQPLLVQKKEGYYEIIAGERRWRAAKLAGLKEVPVIVKNFSNQEAVEISLIENIQREDLNPIEEAKAYERLVSEFGLSQEAVAGRVSKSRSAVANSMRLLRLDERIQKMVEEGILSEGHARTLLALSDPEKQKEVAEKIIKEKLSVRQTERIVRELTSNKVRQQKERDERREAILQSLSEKLKSSLGTRVTIKDSGRHKGKIEIEYYSDEELERLTDLMRSFQG